MARVEIEYCVPCGFLERAEDLQHALLSTFGEQLEGVTLVTGANGVFAVRVDDEVVFEKSEESYDVDEIVRRVRDRV
ncbi:SelT/SelW/SelH family protein [Natronorubrum halophilum]|uniref:SelT/SelW/SelH family protein n=1 Tax=Natronorubrum halophilum TaxID=1702106 RepID=UPI0010C1E04B|nr:Rdx family protein [Natronorubrum halophilum]